MFWKAIRTLFGLLLLTVVLGVITLAGYFWYKSGQPMQVEEAQRMVPGITFREFWQSRVEQWDAWNVELVAIGKRGSCGSSARHFFIPTLVLSVGDLAYMRTYQNADELDAFVTQNNGIIPPDELIFGAVWKLPDALWWYFENVYWFRYAQDSGFPVKALGQQRACSTTYPTPAANGD
jgi:hypothetical protein